MFEEVKPFTKFKSAAGAEWVPVATLKGPDNAVCHVVNDSGSYVAYLNRENFGFFRTEYIFPELFDALVKLPNPANEVTDVAA